MSHRAVLLTGSDSGDREAVLARAAALAAERIGTLAAASEVCASEPWGFASGGEFLNQALALDTELTPGQVLDEALRMECDLGREREAEARAKASTGERYASRVVDIDVMFYDSLAVRTPRLTLPHPLLHERAFALRPLCMIMGDYVHPVLGRTLREIYDELKDRPGAEKL